MRVFIIALLIGTGYAASPAFGADDSLNEAKKHFDAGTMLMKVDDLVFSEQRKGVTFIPSSAL